VTFLLLGGFIVTREGGRYSYRCVINRLINAGLVEYKSKVLVLLRKGFNVLRFEGEKRPRD